VVISNGATLSEKSRDVVTGVPATELVVLRVKEKLPPAAGVPDNTSGNTKLRPGGKVLSAATAQLYGGVPPLAVRTWLYACPCVADGNGLAVVISNGATLSEKSRDVVTGVPAVVSVMLRLKEKLPLAAGAPDNTPAEDKLRPGGRVLPVASAHV
jgi:hypothetical protein